MVAHERLGCRMVGFTRAGPAVAGRGPVPMPLQRRWVAVLAGLLCVGLLLFIRGFLLTRFEVADRSQCRRSDSDSRAGGTASGSDSRGSQASTAAAGCWMPRRFDTAVFVIIDALRYDFAAPDAQVDEHSKAYRGHMPVIGQFLEQQPRNSRLYRFIADGPTTTLQRLKGLTTGSLPTFIDVSANFNSDAIEEDNWVAQLDAHGWHLSFSGDDTWTKVFPHGFTEAHPYPSFNVKDLHGVDNGVIKHLLPAVRERIKIQSAARASANTNAPVGSIVIGHYLGVDHVGHRFGPTHPEMKTKLEQMNSELTELLETVDEHTVVFVMGDHGMTATGDHGGETRDEIDAALFAYTPAGFGHSPPSSLGLGFGTADGMGSMYQTDLVPTLALALGVPIPFGNLGGALTELILPPHLAETADELQWNGWTIVALHANAQQVWRYLESYQAKSQAFPPEMLAQFGGRMAAMQSAYDTLGLSIPSKLTDKLTYKIPLGKDDAERHHQLAIDLASFLRDAAAVCRKHFATFDMGDMVVGLIAMSVILASAVTAGLTMLCFTLHSNFAVSNTYAANEVREPPSSPMQTFVRSSGPPSAEIQLGLPAVTSTYNNRSAVRHTAAVGSMAWDASLGTLGLVSVLVWLGAHDGLGRGLILGCVVAVASHSTRRLIAPAVSELRESATFPGLAGLDGFFTSFSLAGQWQMEQAIGAATLVILHAVSCLSNSFVDAEPDVIRYLLSTGIVAFLVRRAYSLKLHGQQRSHALRIGALLLIVVRMSPTLTVRASHEKLETIATRRVEGYMPLEYSEDIVNQYVGSARWLTVALELLGVWWVKSYRSQTHMAHHSKRTTQDFVGWVHGMVLCVSTLAVVSRSTFSAHFFFAKLGCCRVQTKHACVMRAAWLLGRAEDQHSSSHCRCSPESDHYKLDTTV